MRLIILKIHANLKQDDKKKLKELIDEFFTTLLEFNNDGFILNKCNDEILEKLLSDKDFPLIENDRQIRYAISVGNIKLLGIIFDNLNFIRPEKGSDIYKLGTVETRIEVNKLLFEYAKKRDLRKRLGEKGIAQILTGYLFKLKKLTMFV